MNSTISIVAQSDSDDVAVSFQIPQNVDLEFQNSYAGFFRHMLSFSINLVRIVDVMSSHSPVWVFLYQNQSKRAWHLIIPLSDIFSSTQIIGPVLT